MKKRRSPWAAARRNNDKEEHIMDFDVKAKIEELVKKISGDKTLLEKFTKDPVSAVKSLLGGLDLPADKLEPLISGVKAKLNLDQAGGVLGKLGGLFGGKG